MIKQIKVCDLCDKQLCDDVQRDILYSGHKLPPGREDKQAIFRVVTRASIAMTASEISVHLCGRCWEKVIKEHLDKCNFPFELKPRSNA